MENTTPQDLATSYSHLSDEQQARVLSIVSSQLTIDARTAYRPAVADEIQAFQILRAFNEVQHVITFQLRHLLLRDSDRYPDDTFLKIITEKPGRLGHIVVKNMEAAIRRIES